MRTKNSRSQRRKDRARIKTKRQFHWGYGHKDEWACRMPEAAGEINYMPPKVAGMVINTPTPCSCWMCQNPRHMGFSMKESLTRQELKAEDRFNDEVREWNDYGIWDHFYGDDEVDYSFIEVDYDDDEDVIDARAIDCYLKFMYYKNGGRK